MSSRYRGYQPRGGKGHGYGNSGGSSSGFHGRKSYYAPSNSRGRQPRSGPPRATHQVWMGDIDPQWTEQDIRGIWDQLGLETIQVRIPRTQPVNRNFCFVNFATKELGTQAVQYNGKSVPGWPGRNLRLNWASGSTGDPQNQDEGLRMAKSIGGDIGNAILVTPVVGDEKTLYDYFNARYPMQVRQVKFDHRGAGAIIRFNSVKVAKKAVTEQNGITIEGSKLNLAMVEDEGKQDYTTIVTPQSHPALNQYTDPTNTVILVRNQGPAMHLNLEELRESLSRFGKFSELNGRDEGVCVKFSFRCDAERAILAHHGLEWHDTVLNATWGPSSAGVAAPVYGTIVSRDVRHDASEPGSNRNYVANKLLPLDFFDSV